LRFILFYGFRGRSLSLSFVSSPLACSLPLYDLASCRAFHPFDQVPPSQSDTAQDHKSEWGPRMLPGAASYVLLSLPRIIRFSRLATPLPLPHIDTSHRLIVMPDTSPPPSARFIYSPPPFPFTSLAPSRPSPAIPHCRSFVIRGQPFPPRRFAGLVEASFVPRRRRFARGVRVRTASTHHSLTSRTHLTVGHKRLSPLSSLLPHFHLQVPLRASSFG